MPGGSYCDNKTVVMKQTTELCHLDFIAALNYVTNLSSRITVPVFVHVY
jgi:hypothetical protein